MSSLFLNGYNSEKIYFLYKTILFPQTKQTTQTSATTKI